MCLCYIRYFLLLVEESHSPESTCQNSYPHLSSCSWEPEVRLFLSLCDFGKKNNFVKYLSFCLLCFALYNMKNYITYLEATVLVSSTMVPYCTSDKQTYLCVQMKTNIDEIKLAREYWIYDLNVWIRLGFLYWIKPKHLINLRKQERTEG